MPTKLRPEKIPLVLGASPAEGLDVLLVGWDGGGNVPPMLALGKHLRVAGHRVRMLASPSIGERAASAGLDFAPLTHARAWEPVPGVAIEDNIAALASQLDGPAMGLDLRRAVEHRRPDVLVIDAMASGAISAAEALRVPTAVLCHLRYRFLAGSGPLPGPWLEALEQLNEARTAEGLTPMPRDRGWWTTLWPRVGEVFVTGLPELEGADTVIPPWIRYVGLVADPHPEPLPSDVAALIDGATRGVVVVSLSSTYMHQEQQLARATRAVEGLHAVITVGGGIDPSTLDGGVTALVLRWVAHESLLPRAAVVVTHAGYGTVMASLAAGVPMVCLPMGRDQRGNAAEVERLGAGVTLEAEPTSEAIRAAIDEVLANPRYRRAAMELAAQASALGGGPRLASLVAGLAHSRRSRQPQPAPIGDQP